MIINFSKNHQFATRLFMNENLLELVNETKVLQLKHRADDIEESRAENDTSGDSPR